jgi:putative sugar O-methyltransferase
MVSATPTAFSKQAPPALERVTNSVEQRPEREREIISKLIDSFPAIKEHQKFASAPYLPGAGWKNMEKGRLFYHNAIAQKDTETLASLFRNFFRNEAVAGFWGGNNMFQKFCGDTQLQKDARAILFMKNYGAWRKQFPIVPLKELDAPKIGNPWGYFMDGHILYEPVFGYHYQARYFQSLVAHLENPVVIEVGGGFGGLGYHILKAIPSAKYIGFDLPENCLLQTYYLSCAFPNAKVLSFSEEVNALDRKTIETYDIIVMPNFMLPKVESIGADLIVNVRSLSEMPAETIAEYLQHIDRIGRLWFFHENISEPRRDGNFGIPSSQFPPLRNYVRVAASESRWPTYQADTTYPCQENLFLHRDVLKAGTQGAVLT